MWRRGTETGSVRKQVTIFLNTAKEHQKRDLGKLDKLPQTYIFLKVQEICFHMK